MRRSDRLALGLGVLAAIVATLAGIAHTLDDRILHADMVADQAVKTLTVPTVLNTMNGPTEVKVRDAFVAVVKARPDGSFVRTRRALVASAADPATLEALRRKMVEQHADLLAGRTPSELIFDTAPRRAPFIAAYGPEEEYRTILTGHLNLAPTIRFAHGGWVDATSLIMRVADALAPFFEVLVGVLVVLLAGTILLADRRSTGLRRAGIALLSSAFVLYLVFDGLVAIFFRSDAQRGGGGRGPPLPGHGAVVDGLRRRSWPWPDSRWWPARSSCAAEAHHRVRKRAIAGGRLRRRSSSRGRRLRRSRRRRRRSRRSARG